MDLTALANSVRKDRLQPLIDGKDARVQYSEHVVGQGEALFETMCREGYEGVVSKRADAPYRGKRTQAWLKIKCTRRQEFVIVGWTASSKARGFASLLLGVNGPEGLIYAGKVGTGFDTATMMDLRDRMGKIERKTPDCHCPPRGGEGRALG